MTETPTTEQVNSGTMLIPNAIYSHLGMSMLAVDESNLIQITAFGGMNYTPNAQTELMHRPGSDDWISHMLRARASLARDLTNDRAELDRQRTYLTNLGEAIRDKAIEKEWCEEYDEFAEEWDLPKALIEYDVTVTLRVRARNSDAAEELASENFRLDSYSDEVVDGPEYHAEKAY